MEENEKLVCGGWHCQVDEDTECQLGFTATWDMVQFDCQKDERNK